MAAWAGTAQQQPRLGRDHYFFPSGPACSPAKPECRLGRFPPGLIAPSLPGWASAPGSRLGLWCFEPAGPGSAPRLGLRARLPRLGSSQAAPRLGRLIPALSGRYSFPGGLFSQCCTRLGRIRRIRPGQDFPPGLHLLAPARPG
jgi:hypothetical protein